MKIAYAQMKVAAGRPDVNTRKILQLIDEARAGGADVIIFPELAISGQMLGDTLCQKAFRHECEDYYREICAVFENVIFDKADNRTGDEIAADVIRRDKWTAEEIDRLMDALSESSDLSMTYINRTVERLEAQRQTLLRKQSERRAHPRADFRRIRFATLDFEQKKLVAAQFIQEIRLSEDSVEVVWRV